MPQDDLTSITFINDLGRTVKVDSPKRAAALTGSFADVWCLAGGKDNLVASVWDAWTSATRSLGFGKTMISKDQPDARIQERETPTRRSTSLNMCPIPILEKNKEDSYADFCDLYIWNNAKCPGV